MMAERICGMARQFPAAFWSLVHCAGDGTSRLGPEMYLGFSSKSGDDALVLPEKLTSFRSSPGPNIPAHRGVISQPGPLPVFILLVLLLVVISFPRTLNYGHL